MAWTKEKDELIKKLWADGLSASQIAAEIGGVSRNAIIGRVHRLGIAGRQVSRLGREARLEQEVIQLFKEAKFKVASSEGFPSRVTGDFVAEHTLLGSARRYAIKVVAEADRLKVIEYASRLRDYARQSKQPFAEFDEFWLVAAELTDGAPKDELSHDRQFRAVDLGELKAILAQQHSTRSKPLAKGTAKRTARTKIGKAIEENEKEMSMNSYCRVV
jgi:hypothetical protein